MRHRNRWSARCKCARQQPVRPAHRGRLATLFGRSRQLFNEFFCCKVDEFLLVSDFPQFPPERVSQLRSAQNPGPVFPSELRGAGEDLLEYLGYSFLRNYLFRVVGDDRRTTRRDAPPHNLDESIYLTGRKKPQDHALPPVAPAIALITREKYIIAISAHPPSVRLAYLILMAIL